MTRIPVTLTVNGEAHHLLIEPHRTLLEVLRGDLGLTGTKENCLEAECGVCTVLLDGMALNSCILLAARCQGRRVTTIDGHGESRALRALQESFVEAGAVQCGYCIPGMILSAAACLEESPAPSEDEIREALAGNLCRCTGYQKIVDAVLGAARRVAEER